MSGRWATAVFKTPEALDRLEMLYWRERAHRFGEWEFRLETGDVLVAGQHTAYLTEAEAELLDLLIRAYPRPLAPGMIVERLKQHGVHYSSVSIKVLIRRLRRKLGYDLIYTHPRGYVFDAHFAAACGIDKSASHA